MRRIILLGVALLAAACATVPGPSVVTPREGVARVSQLQALDDFRLDGRLAVAVGQEGFSATLAWAQRGARSELELRAPLGFGTARIVREAGAVRLDTSRGERFDGPEAEDDLAARLGFRPPLDSLRYWVLGVPDPHRPVAGSTGDEGRPSSLDQEGWHVDFSDYRVVDSARGTYWLPRRLSLLREGVRLRLVVDHWVPGES